MGHVEREIRENLPFSFRPQFLDAPYHLYMRVCPFVGWLVGWLVCPLVCPSVTHSLNSPKFDILPISTNIK